MFGGDFGRFVKNPVKTVKKKTKSLIKNPIGTIAGDVGKVAEKLYEEATDLPGDLYRGVKHYAEEIVEAPGDVWRQAENVAEDIIEGGEHLVREIGDAPGDIVEGVSNMLGGGGGGDSGLPDEIREQMQFDLERSKYVFDLMKGKLPEAEQEIRRTFDIGTNLIQSSAALAAQQAGRMAALGYSSGAVSEALRGITGSVSQSVLPLTAQMQESLVQVSPAYAQAMMLGSGLGAQYGSAMAGFQQPSMFDRLLQIGAIASMFV